MIMNEGKLVQAIRDFLGVAPRTGLTLIVDCEPLPTPGVLGIKSTLTTPAGGERVDFFTVEDVPLHKVTARDLVCHESNINPFAGICRN